MINWKVRAKQKWFWIALIPALLVLARAVAAVFGYELDFSTLSDKLLAVVESVFTVLAVLGIVVDPTTEGIQDSKLAMTYQEPKPYDTPTDSMKPPDTVREDDGGRYE